MNVIRDFLLAAWPWIAIGLVIAIISVAYNIKSEKKRPKKSDRFLIGASIAFVTFVIEYSIGGFMTMIPQFGFVFSICYFVSD